MKPKVYVETTIVSYLTAWPSRDAIVHGKQQTTIEWWASAGKHFDLVASQLVINEASGGDPDAAKKRLEVLRHVPLVDLTEDATRLAKQLLGPGLIPPKAAEDAGHIAVAVTNGIDYLVTWNCRHIANATTRRQIDQACLDRGYTPTTICTPDELSGNRDET